MNKIKTWILNNKLSSVLILILVYFLYKAFFGYSLLRVTGLNQKANYGSAGMAVDSMMPMMESASGRSAAIAPIGGAAPTMDVTDRMVVTNSQLSLLVTDVNQEIENIKAKTKSVGGYMVNSNITNPEEMTNGALTIRVPSAQLDGMLEYLRALSVKVVSENISGHDVTDQYIDIEERLQTYETTKARYEGILESATDVNDILTVTEKIIYVQNQIDNLKGQMNYLSTTSQSSLITIYLSTDELELPYAPEETWRPSVIFKYAVRSLVRNVRKLAGAGIWIAVYLPVIALAWALYKFAKKIIRNKNTVDKQNQS